MYAPYYDVSRDAARALEEFSTELDMALASIERVAWSRQFGVAHTGKFKTTYPIPISAARFLERKGDDRYRDLFKRSLSMTPVKYHDGVEVLSDVVEAPDFIGWGAEPARIAKESREHINILVAAMLNSNPNLDFYRDEEIGTASAIALFANNHPINVFDTSVTDLGGSATTFDNLHSAAAINAAMMSAAMTRFGTRPGPDGRPLGLRVTDMVVPPALEQSAKDFLDSDNVLTALSQGADAAAPLGWTNNRWKNAVNLIVAHELLDSDYIYLLDRAGPAPWITQSQEVPEEIRFDKDSDYWKRTGKIAVGYVLTDGVKACLPHAIEKIQITG